MTSAFVGTNNIGDLLVGDTSDSTPPAEDEVTPDAYQNASSFGTPLFNQTIRPQAYQNPNRYGVALASNEDVITVIKWQLYDAVTDETFVFDLNPQDVEYTGRVRSFKLTRTPLGRIIVSYGKINTATITFSGWLPTLELLDNLREWTLKEYQVRLTDELGRQNWYYLNNFAASRVPTKSGSWSGGPSQSQIITAYEYTVDGMEMNAWGEV